VLRGVIPETPTAMGSKKLAVSPHLGLAGVVLVGFVAYASLAHFVSTPRIFFDELLYLEAADSLASGEGLEVRGEPYVRGVLYPLLLAPLLWIAPDREAAYELAKLLNALVFVLAAIPVFSLARRLLPAWPSVGVASLSIAVPSAVYVTVVMTESLSYLTACCALLAIQLAVERPTALRQGAALAAIALAFLTRAQFVALYAAYLLALALVVLLVPARRAESRRLLVALWPTALSVVVGLVAFVVTPLARGDSPLDSIGDYDAIVRVFDPLSMAEWLVYHVAGLELYLAVVPVAVAPIVCSAYFARARGGSERHGAFLATFVAVNAAVLLLVAFVVANYEDTELGIDRLHDRYLFYVVPLWLILLFSWIRSGAPRPVRAAGLGASLALLLAVVFPYRELDIEDGTRLFSATGTALPAAIRELAGSAFVGGIVVVLLTAGLVAAALRRPEKAARVSIGALVAVFVLNGLLVWARAYNPPERDVFDGARLERRWVDERVPEGASVALVQAPCSGAVLERDSFYVTEFFNSSVRQVVDVGGEFPTGRLDGRGRVLLNSGKALEADHVVAQPGVPIRGRRVGSGTSAGLVLWKINGPVRIDGAASPGDLVRRACGGSGA
jgi:hypothetical protein